MASRYMEIELLLVKADSVLLCNFIIAASEFSPEFTGQNSGGSRILKRGVPVCTRLIA